jgi:hypothetical protein
MTAPGTDEGGKLQLAVKSAELRPSAKAGEDAAAADEGTAENEVARLKRSMSEQAALIGTLRIENKKLKEALSLHKVEYAG